MRGLFGLKENRKRNRGTKSSLSPTCHAGLGLADRTAIEFFDGPHTIHGVGTFEFLHKHLNWPEPTD
jgi:hypothetical protein